jgi:uncharacterized membrane protein required for colicin V production
LQPDHPWCALQRTENPCFSQGGITARPSFANSGEQNAYTIAALTLSVQKLSNMNAHKLAISLMPNWFDFVVVIVILMGANKGRKNGMSQELMPCLQWVAIVLAASYFYKPLGDMLATSSPVSHLFAYIMVYILLVMAVKIVFSLIKKGAGGKLMESNVFGRTEFYLGPVAGMLRFACVLVAALALLNARAYSNQEVNKSMAYQKDMYGSASLFPQLYEVQAAIFRESVSGSALHEYAGFLLINGTAPEHKEIERRKADLP